MCGVELPKEAEINDFLKNIIFLPSPVDPRLNKYYNSLLVLETQNREIKRKTLKVYL